ncbi:MAG: fumarylacetoacetate hydrolase family protein [Polyangiaceae bacterium]
MKIARVLQPASATPILALEQSGWLYDVAELDRHHDTRFAPERFGGAGDFHTRVCALGAAGMAELDEALRAGSRPRDARLLPDSFLWLPPCDTERALWVCFPHADTRDPASEPSYALGNARALLGHREVVPFPAREQSPDLEVGVAALIGDELYRATAAEARAALVGFTVLASWIARGEEERGGRFAARARDFGAQLGPWLVDAAEVPDLARVAVRVRAAHHGGWVPCGRVGDAPLRIDEAIAFASDHVRLAPGDLVSVGLISASAARLPLAWGSDVEVQLEGIGTLVGRPARGPDAVPWRAD